LLGYWVTKSVHAIEGKIYGKGFDHETEDEKRDFLATGAACGITTAFRAPLAGTLFVVEEAGSFFSTKHLEFTFFSCLISYWAQWVIGLMLDGESAADAKFQQTTGYFCNVDNPLNMVAYLMMAILGGCLGALFNQIVEQLNHWRSEYINMYGWRRLVEVLFLVLLTGSVVIFLPQIGICRNATRDVMLRDSAGCLPVEDFAQVSYGEVQFGYLKTVVDNTTTANFNYKDSTSSTSSTSSSSSSSSSSSTSSTRRLLLSATEEDADIKLASDLKKRWLADAAASGANPLASGGDADTIPSFYNSAYGSGSRPSNDLRNVIKKIRVVPEHRQNVHDTVILDNAADQGPYIHVHYEHTYTCGKKSHTYNDMAMLWLNGGVKGVKVLMQRGFPHLIHQTTLWWFLGVYFLLAAFTAGTHVPAGLVVPLLLIGGAFGRLFGIYWMNFKKGLCENYIELDSAPEMMTLGTDPSAWLGYDMYYWGMTYRWIIRDCKLPDPGTFAVIGMASFMGGSGRISVMLAVVMLELTADAKMVAPVGIVCILAMLVGNFFNHGLYHGLIPVMNLPYLNAQPAQVMYVTRVIAIMSRHLVFLPQMCLPGELHMLKIRYDNAKHSAHITHHGFPVVRSSYDKHLVGLLSKNALDHLLRDLEIPNRRREILRVDGRIDLTMYCDRSPLSVQATTTVARAYAVFTKLGLRHLVVLGHTGKVEGLVTRKDLMVFRIAAFKENEIKYIKMMQSSIRRNLKNIGFYDRKGVSRTTSRKAIASEKRMSKQGIEGLSKKRGPSSTRLAERLADSAEKGHHADL
jgi:H+/Cl- antiporter ClcA/CBS domain-containing protein